MLLGVIAILLQLTLTLKMTIAQVVETSVTVNNNSPIQDYVQPDDKTQPFEMTPGFKPFTLKRFVSNVVLSTCMCMHIMKKQKVNSLEYHVI